MLVLENFNPNPPICIVFLGQSSRLPLLPGTRGGGGFPVGVFNTQQFAANNPTAAQIRDEYVVDLTDQPGSRCKICNKERISFAPAIKKVISELMPLRK